MENLLPTVAAADVTSDEFREKTLPYQQWEADRTHVAPGTPLDVRHLLPPIGSRNTRRVLSERSPIAPHAEPSFPQPAPVDRNLSDLYDPALDPSPIGMEDRGIVQQIRSTRIVPRRESGAAKQGFSRGGGVTRQGGGADCGGGSATVVTVLNGYSCGETTRELPTFGDGSGGGGVDADSDEPCCVDIFVQGFSTGGIEHAALAPSAVFRGALHRRPMSLAVPEHSANVPEESTEIMELRGDYLGLTVFLARADDWSDYDNAHDYSNNGGGTHRQGVGMAHFDGVTPEQSEKPMQQQQQSESITRIIFEREDGTPGPSPNAFRVQFEPGPLGMELEEDPDQRGVVRIRRLLQAGQAEHDGRFSVGCLIVAVGDWAGHDNSISDDIVLDEPGGPRGGRSGRNGWSVRSERSERSTSSPLGNNKRLTTTVTTRTCPVIIRSLRQLEEVVSNRKDGQLFVVWALDRLAPEAIAALGIPRPTTTCARKPFHRWPSNLLYSRHKEFYRTEAAGFDSDIQGAHGDEHSPHVMENGRGSLYSANTRFSRSSGDGTQGRKGGGAPRWWQSNRAFGGKDRSKFSMSGDEERVSPVHDRARGGTGGTGESRDHQEGTESEDEMVAIAVADGYPPNNSALGTSPSPGGGGGGGGGGWEFETGGGIFDENDQGLAGRKQPRRNDDALESADDEPEQKRPLLPLGLQASTADDVPACLWFCNNHESATMKVSWIDYGGKRVLRRSLEPGGCYFERSFATHPWVVEYNNSNSNNTTTITTTTTNNNNNNTNTTNTTNNTTNTTTTNNNKDDGDCCVVRLGNAMAVEQFSGSLIWNPARKTLSVTKQARVGVSGMSSSAVAAVGAAAGDGAGLDPGKKRLCMAGASRESYLVRAVAERASVRAEKARILEEMRTWRTQPPPSSSGTPHDRSAAWGLGRGAPNLRVVMMGSSACNSDAR
ncbi:unnamed protein product [Laminaria digitata]